jgi:hypothetical protein
VSGAGLEAAVERPSAAASATQRRLLHVAEPCQEGLLLGDSHPSGVQALPARAAGCAAAALAWLALRTRCGGGGLRLEDGPAGVRSLCALVLVQILVGAWVDAQPRGSDLDPAAGVVDDDGGPGGVQRSVHRTALGPHGGAVEGGVPLAPRVAWVAALGLKEGACRLEGLELAEPTQLLDEVVGAQTGSEELAITDVVREDVRTRMSLGVVKAGVEGVAVETADVVVTRGIVVF